MTVAARMDSPFDTNICRRARVNPSRDSMERFLGRHYSFTVISWSSFGNARPRCHEEEAGRRLRVEPTDDCSVFHGPPIHVALPAIEGLAVKEWGPIIVRIERDGRQQEDKKQIPLHGLKVLKNTESSVYNSLSFAGKRPLSTSFPFSSMQRNRRPF